MKEGKEEGGLGRRLAYEDYEEAIGPRDSSTSISTGPGASQALDAKSSDGTGAAADAPSDTGSTGAGAAGVGAPAPSASAPGGAEFERVQAQIRVHGFEEDEHCAATGAAMAKVDKGDKSCLRRFDGTWTLDQECRPAYVCQRMLLREIHPARCVCL